MAAVDADHNLYTIAYDNPPSSASSSGVIFQDFSEAVPVHDHTISFTYHTKLQDIPHDGDWIGLIKGERTNPEPCDYISYVWARERSTPLAVNLYRVTLLLSHNEESDLNSYYHLIYVTMGFGIIGCSCRFQIRNVPDEFNASNSTSGWHPWCHFYENEHFETCSVQSSDSESTISGNQSSENLHLPPSRSSDFVAHGRVAFQNFSEWLTFMTNMKRQKKRMQKVLVKIPEELWHTTSRDHRKNAETHNCSAMASNHSTTGNNYSSTADSYLTANKYSAKAMHQEAANNILSMGDKISNADLETEDKHVHSDKLDETEQTVKCDAKDHVNSQPCCEVSDSDGEFQSSDSDNIISGNQSSENLNLPPFTSQSSDFVAHGRVAFQNFSEWLAFMTNMKQQKRRMQKVLVKNPEELWHTTSRNFHSRKNLETHRLSVANSHSTTGNIDSSAASNYSSNNYSTQATHRYDSSKTFSMGDKKSKNDPNPEVENVHSDKLDEMEHAVKCESKDCEMASAPWTSYFISSEDGSYDNWWAGNKLRKLVSDDYKQTKQSSFVPEYLLWDQNTRKSTSVEFATREKLRNGRSSSSSMESCQEAVHTEDAFSSLYSDLARAHAKVESLTKELRLSSEIIEAQTRDIKQYKNMMTLQVCELQKCSSIIKSQSMGLIQYQEKVHAQFYELKSLNDRLEPLCFELKVEREKKESITRELEETEIKLKLHSAELEKKSAELASVKIILDTMSKELSEFQNREATRSSEILMLKDKLEQQGQLDSSELQNLRTELESTKTKLEQERSRFMEMKLLADQVQSRSEEIISLKDTIQSQAAGLLQYKTKIVSLMTQVNSDRIALKKRHKMLDAFKMEIKQSKEQEEILIAGLEQHRTKQECLLAEIELKKRELRQTQMQLNDVSEALEECQAGESQHLQELEQYKTNTELLLAEVVQLQSVKSSLSAELDQIKTTREFLLSELEQLNSSNKLLLEDIQKNQTNEEAISKELQQAKANEEMLSNELEKRLAKEEFFSTELQKSNLALKSVDEELMQSRKDEETILNELFQLRTSHEYLQSKLDDCILSKEELLADINQNKMIQERLSIELQQSQASVNKISEHVKQLETNERLALAELEKSKTSEVALRKEFQQQEMKLSLVTSELKQSVDGLKGIQEVNKQLVAELEERKCAENRLHKELQKSENKLDLLTAELKESLHSVKSVTRDMKQVQERNEVLFIQLEQSKFSEKQLCKQLKESEIKLDLSTSELKQSLYTINSITEEMKQLQERNKALTTELEQSKASKEHLCRELQLSQNSLKSESENMEQLQKNNEILISELKQNKVNEETLNNDLKQSEIKLASATIKLKEYLERLNLICDRNNQMQVRNEALSAELEHSKANEKLCSELQISKISDEYNAEYKQVWASLKSISDNMQHHKARNQALAAELAQSKVSEERLQKELEKSKAAEANLTVKMKEYLTSETSISKVIKYQPDKEILLDELECRKTYEERLHAELQQSKSIEVPVRLMTEFKQFATMMCKDKKSLTGADLEDPQHSKAIQTETDKELLPLELKYDKFNEGILSASLDQSKRHDELLLAELKQSVKNEKILLAELKNYKVNEGILSAELRQSKSNEEDLLAQLKKYEEYTDILSAQVKNYKVNAELKKFRPNKKLLFYDRKQAKSNEEILSTELKQCKLDGEIPSTKLDQSVINEDMISTELQEKKTSDELLSLELHPDKTCAESLLTNALECKANETFLSAEYEQSKINKGLVENAEVISTDNTKSSVLSTWSNNSEGCEVNHETSDNAQSDVRRCLNIHAAEQPMEAKNLRVHDEVSSYGLKASASVTNLSVFIEELRSKLELQSEELTKHKKKIQDLLYDNLLLAAQNKFPGKDVVQFNKGAEPHCSSLLENDEVMTSVERESLNILHEQLKTEKKFREDFIELQILNNNELMKQIMLLNNLVATSQTQIENISKHKALKDEKITGVCRMEEISSEKNDEHDSLPYVPLLNNFYSKSFAENSHNREARNTESSSRPCDETNFVSVNKHQPLPQCTEFSFTENEAHSTKDTELPTAFCPRKSSNKEMSTHKHDSCHRSVDASIHKNFPSRTCVCNTDEIDSESAISADDGDELSSFVGAFDGSRLDIPKNQRNISVSSSKPIPSTSIRPRVRTLCVPKPTDHGVSEVLSQSRISNQLSTTTNSQLDLIEDQPSCNSGLPVLSLCATRNPLKFISTGSRTSTRKGRFPKSVARNPIISNSSDKDTASHKTFHRKKSNGARRTSAEDSTGRDIKLESEQNKKERVIFQTLLRLRENLNNLLDSVGDICPEKKSLDVVSCPSTDLNETCHPWTQYMDEAHQTSEKQNTQYASGSIPTAQPLSSEPFSALISQLFEILAIPSNNSQLEQHRIATRPKYNSEISSAQTQVSLYTSKHSLSATGKKSSYKNFVRGDSFSGRNPNEAPSSVSLSSDNAEPSGKESKTIIDRKSQCTQLTCDSGKSDLSMVRRKPLPLDNRKQWSSTSQNQSQSLAPETRSDRKSSHDQKTVNYVSKQSSMKLQNEEELEPVIAQQMNYATQKRLTPRPPKMKLSYAAMAKKVTWITDGKRQNALKPVRLVLPKKHVTTDGSKNVSVQAGHRQW